MSISEEVAAAQAGKLSLQISRSDYLIHSEEGDALSIKQVEFNTISCGFISLAARMSQLHQCAQSVCTSSLSDIYKTVSQKWYLQTPSPPIPPTSASPLQCAQPLTSTQSSQSGSPPPPEASFNAGGGMSCLWSKKTRGTASTSSTLSTSSGRGGATSFACADVEPATASRPFGGL